MTRSKKMPLSLPRGPGAYALVIRLESDLAADIGALGSVTLPAGRYVYLGSARGPGGIDARVRRHLRADRKMHWHVDRLTLAGTVTHVAAWPDGSECALTDCLLADGRVTVPVPGFGATDCRRCAAHLLAVPGRGGLARRFGPLGAVAVYSAASLLPSAVTEPSIV